MSNFYGLIGENLGHSMSHKIHDLILKKMGLKGVYNLFEIKRENLKIAVEGLKALEVKGLNVTIPYKIQTLQYLNKISKEAEKIGAVNTIAFNDGIFIGYNTDYNAFGATLKKFKVDVYDKSAVILGTGGVSNAVAQYLMDNKIKDIIYVSRKSQDSLGTTKNLKIITYNEINNLKDKDIIINCTPCGMYPNLENSPVSKDILSQFSIAVDLIYNPAETVFLKWAKEEGLKTVNGLYMLVAQAIASQEIWNGIKISEELAEGIYKEIKDNFD